MCVLWWAFKWLDFVYVLLHPSCGHVWMTCFRLDQVRFFLGLPDLVMDEDDFVLFFKLDGVGTVVDGGTAADVAAEKVDLVKLGAALAGW